MQIEFKKVIDIYSAINIGMAVYSMYQFGGLIFWENSFNAEDRLPEIFKRKKTRNAFKWGWLSC